MANTKPIRGRNAIDEIAFVILFQNSFDDQSIIKLIGLREKLSPRLPECDLVKMMEVKVEGDNLGFPTSKVGGVVYSKKIDGGTRLEWSLRASANQLVVTCSEYTNWREVLQKAKSFLCQAVERLDLDVNPIVGIVFQCVDKFRCQDAPAEYSISEVFDKESRYLNRHVCENPGSWHIHQGWFEPLESDQARGLNNLNLNVVIGQNNEPLHETVISHLVTVTQGDASSAVTDMAMFFGEDGELGYFDQVLSDSYKLNKCVITDLLTAEMLITIGLGKEGSE